MEQREQGITFEVCGIQTKIALLGVTEEEMKNVIIAYEPVWAIGTGKPLPQTKHKKFVNLSVLCLYLYSDATAQATTIQYGGSMNAGNADELLSKYDVDGGLIGGASLKAEDFAKIVKAASN